MSENSSELISQLEKEGDIAADYLEGLLDIADLDGDLVVDVEGERALVSITGERSRLMIDISGYRAARKAALAELGFEACERVKKTGEAVALESMNPFERKVVHDAVAEAGLKSESEGEEPNRYVVVLPA
jgi:spoIIIJ-associated protein